MDTITPMASSCPWPNVVQSSQQNSEQLHGLLGRLRVRDEAAFQELIERYATKIYRVCQGILRHRHDADEITQEVFVKVYVSIDSFASRGSLYGWIHRIAVNKCYQLLRARRWARICASNSDIDTHNEMMQTMPDGRPTPDRIAMLRDFINKLLLRVPEEGRWLIIVKKVEGLSIAELAGTGLSESTIKVKLFRLRLALAAAAATMSRLRRPPNTFVLETRR